MKKMLFTLVPASLILRKMQLNSTSFFLTPLYLPVVFLMQRGSAAYCRTAFACVILLKGTHTNSAVGHMLYSMGQRPGHVLGKIQAPSSKASQAKIELVTVGGRKMSWQLMMG